jgi:hypothetical protein
MSKSMANKVNTYSKNVTNACLTQATTEKDALADANHAKSFINAELSGTKHMANIETNSNLLKANQILIENTNCYRKSFNDMTALQAQIINQSKVLTQQSKDYANQVGEALARIDKVIVKDFEVKLLLLERFVIASKELVELEKVGALSKVANSFFK